MNADLSSPLSRAMVSPAWRGAWPIAWLLALGALLAPARAAASVGSVLEGGGSAAGSAALAVLALVVTPLGRRRSHGLFLRSIAILGLLTCGMYQRDLLLGAAGVVLALDTLLGLVYSWRLRRRLRTPWRARVLASVLDAGRSPSLR